MNTERVKEAGFIHRGLGRAEFFDFSEAQFAGLQDTLDAMAAEGRERFSFHAPIVRPDYFPHSGVTCYFLSEDRGLRELSFRLLEHTLRAAARWGVDYVVTHLTFGPADTRDEATAQRLAQEACGRIAAMSDAEAVPVDIEFAAYTDAFHSAEQFLHAMAMHPQLGVCIDIGHAFIGARRRGRDYLQDIAALAPRARSLHLWNSLGEEHTRLHHHTPLHPSQQAGDGWIDVEQALRLALGANPDMHVIFEYPVDDVSDEIQAGYDWVAGLVSRPG